MSSPVQVKHARHLSTNPRIETAPSQHSNSPSHSPSKASSKLILKPKNANNSTSYSPEKKRIIENFGNPANANGGSQCDMYLTPCRWSKSGWKYTKAQDPKFFENPNKKNFTGLASHEVSAPAKGVPNGQAWFNTTYSDHFAKNQANQTTSNSFYQSRGSEMNLPNGISQAYPPVPKGSSTLMDGARATLNKTFDSNSTTFIEKKKNKYIVTANNETVNPAKATLSGIFGNHTEKHERNKDIKFWAGTSVPENRAEFNRKRTFFTQWEAASFQGGVFSLK